MISKHSSDCINPTENWQNICRLQARFHGKTGWVFVGPGHAVCPWAPCDCYEKKCLRKQAQTCLIKMQDLSHVQQRYTDSPQRGPETLQKVHLTCTSLAWERLQKQAPPEPSAYCRQKQKQSNKNVPAFQTSTFQQAPQENENKEEKH